MTDFNAEYSDKEFYKGKRYLDSGRYLDAIEIYDNLISLNEKFAGNKEVNILLETSLNNRGIAKCKVALQRKDKELYKSGMADFQKSIIIDNPTNDDEKEWLTAYKNLVFSEQEILEFDKEENRPNTNFRSFFSV